MLPPRGRKIFAKSLAQSYLVLSYKFVCFNQKLYGLAANRFPGVLPFPRSIFCSALAYFLSVAVTSTAPRVCGQADIKISTAFCRRNFLSVLAVEASVFCAWASLLCSALALRRGTSRRFERLVWASLHLSERSRTIEVRVATLSAQTCTKSLTQSYLFYLSITCYFTYKDKK